MWSLVLTQYMFFCILRCRRFARSTALDVAGNNESSRKAPLQEKQPDCPASSTGNYWGTTRGKWFATNSDTNSEFSGSYGYNYWVSTQKEDNGWRLAKYHYGTDLLKSAHNVPLFSECIWIGGYPADSDLPRPSEIPYNSGSGEMNRFLLNRHNSKTNIVTLDGHAATIELRNLWTYKWHREFNVGNAVASREYDFPDWMKLRWRRQVRQIVLLG